MKTYFIWINGEFIHHSKVPTKILEKDGQDMISLVNDFRCYRTSSGTAVFRLTEHVKQFLDAVRGQDFEIHISEETLCEMVQRTLLFNNIEEGHIRISLRAKKTDYGFATYPYEDENAIILSITTWDREDQSSDASENSTSLPGLVLGYDVPNQAAIFLVKGKQITTPPSKAYGNSLVRDAVMTIARDLGFVVEEQPITRKQISTADEVFLSTAIGDLRHVREFDSNPIGSGKRGPITTALMNAFNATMQGHGKRSGEWLEWVGASYVGL